MTCSVLPLLEKVSVDKIKIMVSLAVLFIAHLAKAQQAFMEKHTADSLYHIIELDKQDSNQVHAFYSLSRGTTLSNTNKSIELGNKGLDLARKIKFPVGELECLEALSFSYAITSSFEK